MLLPIKPVLTWDNISWNLAKINNDGIWAWVKQVSVSLDCAIRVMIIRFNYIFVHYPLAFVHPLHSIQCLCFCQQVRSSVIHYSDLIMGTMASQINSLTIIYSTVYSGADQRKHQSSTSLAFVRRIHRWLVNSLHKWPVMRKMFPFDDAIIWYR